MSQVSQMSSCQFVLKPTPQRRLISYIYIKVYINTYSYTLGLPYQSNNSLYNFNQV